MSIEFWLSFNNGAERLRLPVNPASVSFTYTHGFEDVDITGLGDYTIIGNAKLTDVSFSSVFPKEYAPYCEYEDIPDPWESVELIRKWQTSSRPMRLTIAGTPINMAATIRSFDIEPERAGSPGDIYYTISFREYVFVEFRTVNTVKDTNVVKIASASSSRPNTLAKPTSYVVKKGDSLWKIAAKPEIYDKGDEWRRIYNANRDVIGPNPNLIYPGQKLVIPR